MEAVAYQTEGNEGALLHEGWEFLIHGREWEEMPICRGSAHRPKAGGDLGNINRWRGQINLDPMTSAGLSTIE